MLVNYLLSSGGKTAHQVKVWSLVLKVIKILTQALQVSLLLFSFGKSELSRVGEQYVYTLDCFNISICSQRS